jgi:putative PEP-CTERM system TPR-repeat lipoprotein
MEHNMKLQFKIIPLVVALALSGCNKQTAEELVVQAQTELAQDETSAAIILLKNAILSEPSNAEARFLLGKSYIKSGAAASAEKELTRALALGYEQNDVLPLLANAYSFQYKHQEIIDLVNNTKNLDPNVETSLLMFQALAYFQTDKPNMAKMLIKQANEISVDSIYSQLGNAYASFSNQQIDDSLEKVDKLLEQSPDLPDAMLLKAQLFTIKGDSKEAVQYFEKYSELLPNLLVAKVFLANAYLKNQQFDKSESQVDQLLKVNKDQPFLNQLKGLIRYQDKDFENAKFFSEKAIRNGMDTTENRIISGISSFRLENYAQAFQHLSNIESEFSNEHPLKRLIAIVNLKLGFGIESAEQLLKIEGITEADMILLSAISSQLIQSGNLKQAKSLLEQTDSITFTDPLRIAQKGMLKLSLKDLEGITDLKDALVLDPNLEIAQIGLAASYIQNALFDEAIDLANSWINDSPQKLKGYILAASAYLGKNDFSQAEEMYDKLLTIDPANPAANIYYADKSVSQNKIDEAKTYLEVLLSGYPNYLSALAKYFVLQEQLGKAEEGLNAFETAIAEQQDSEKLKLLYAQALFTVQNFSKATEILGEMAPSEWYPDIYWIVLSDSFYALGETRKGLKTVQKWVELSPNNRSANLKLIIFNELMGDIPEARRVASDALLRFKDESKFVVLLSYFDFLTGNLSEAQRGLDSLSLEDQKTSIAQGIEGMILLDSGEPVAAYPKLLQYYKLNPSIQSAIFVAKSLKLQNKLADSSTFLKAHLGQGSNSNMIRIRIAELAIGLGDLKEAKEQYLTILKSESENIRALNNLSNIYLEESDFSNALLYSEIATSLSPNNTSILGTYASILSNLGRNEDALVIYGKAYRLSSSSIELGIRYVKALVINKQNQKALSILNTFKTEDLKLQLKISEVRESI